MISDYRCFFCFVHAFEVLLEKEKLSVTDKNTFTRQMAERYSQNLGSFSAPLFARELHLTLRAFTGNADPYREAKRRSNDLVLGMYLQLKDQILNSENPYDTALRLAVAGNIIDLAVCSEYNLPATISKVLSSDFATDNSKELKQELATAKRVLYLGDNAGEVVFDKLFIETIMHPNLTYAVRGSNIINDATIDDATYVGMQHVADVISNGYDAPSTLLDCCSTEFREAYMQADVIIAKGQGNLEGLFSQSQKDFYSLLMVKCDVIADALGVRKGDFVIKKVSSAK